MADDEVREAIQPRPMPTPVAAAELKEALIEEDSWKVRLLDPRSSGEDMQEAARRLVSAHYRVKAARLQVGAEAGILELQTRLDHRPRFIGDEGA